MSQVPAAVLVGGAVLVVPALITRFVVGASWPQVALAFPLYWLVLMLLLGFGRINEEVLGWTLIMSMFTSWAAVPIVGLGLRLLSIPQRFL